MAKKVEILFTGLNKAKFKTGNSMMREVRKHVKEFGKENVSLVHGGRPKVSKIDRNVIKVGEITGLNVISNPLDFSHKNATGIRDQERIDNPNLVHYSYDSKGNLSLKDKYAGYWKNKYGEIGKETSGGKLRFPRSTVKNGKVIGKQTKETSKFKSLLDEIEDDTNPERQASGVTYAKRLDKWTKENLDINMITSKNQGRIEYLESGGVMSKDEKGLPTLIRQQPSFKKEYKSIDDFEQKTYVEDTSPIGREGQSDTAGLTKLPFKAINKGTLLTNTKKIKDSGNLTNKQMANKNPYPQSSMSQIVGSSEYEDYKGQAREGVRKVQIKNSLKQLTDVTDITGEATGEDKAKSGKGIERHKTSHLLREQPIKDRVELKRALKRAAPVFKRISEAKAKARTSTNIPRRIKNLKKIDLVTRTLAKRIPDRLAFDAAQPSDTSTPARSSTVQSSGLKNVPVPSATKVEKIKATKDKIAKGPLGGKKAKGTGWWEGTRRRVTPVGKGNFPFALSTISTVTGVARARKEAKQYTQKKDPSFFDTMKMMNPSFFGKPRKKFGLNPGDA